MKCECIFQINIFYSRFDVSGCNGGTDTGAYKWMMKYGLPTEEEYGPYANEVIIIILALAYHKFVIAYYIYFNICVKK